MIQKLLHSQKITPITTMNMQTMESKTISRGDIININSYLTVHNINLNSSTKLNSEANQIRSEKLLNRGIRYFSHTCRLFTRS